MSFKQPFIYLFIHIFIHSSMYLIIHSFEYLLISSFILFIYLFISLFIHSFIRPYNHLFPHSFIYSFFLSSFMLMICLICCYTHSVAVCPSVISNGRLLAPCRYDVGSSCLFACNTGYNPATKEPITCQHDMQWSRDTTRLCLGSRNN